MKDLIELTKKEKKNVIGLMSGTSLDGVDVALIKIEGSGTFTKLELIGFLEYPFPKGLKSKLLKNSVKETSNVEDISQLNFLLPKIYFDAIRTLCNDINFEINDIDLIGSHGQTIHHLPKKVKNFGYNISSTLQIGDPTVLAKLSGIITIGDFRTGDMALGGEGAPLIPYFDYLLFHSHQKNRALLNIGGISNFTILNKDKGLKDVLAFDTGPGNMLIDTLTKLLFNLEYDKDGNFARSGKLNNLLFDALIKKDEFIERIPPKSTGREYYGESFLNNLLSLYKNVSKEDWLNTVTKFTAYGIHRNYEKFVKDETRIDELIISGGGAKNRFLYECLKEEFSETVEIKIIDDIGISSDAKEAICFAVMANETISGNPTNIPRTTGASRSTILGKICLP
ncbi:MAG: anhydro-N-acetylmuramic acid kinase [Ignavibacteriales bacterium]|nr:anhydro-N-acetylmuramic acid kinase [Ignavibacteriales bacterium]MCB9259773.1 anhydro-N-acetylmuramic acid kinase [Ignavibacteriales bacterium]